MTDPIEPEDNADTADGGAPPSEAPISEEAPTTDRPEPDGHPTDFPRDDRPTTTEIRAAEPVGEASEEPPDVQDDGEHDLDDDHLDPEATVNLTGDLDATLNMSGGEPASPARDDAAAAGDVTRGHLKGLLEALVFASDRPIKAAELAKTASAPGKQVRELLDELRQEYATRGMQLDEVAGGWIFRTSAAYAPFVRDLTKQKPVKLTRAQIETLAILAYRQPITRPEIDDIRGVDCGPVLKLLLERDLIRILGKKDEPGRPLLYGTTTQFLEFFGLKSLKDLPTLREFTDLNEESRRVVEKELGETLESTAEAQGAIDAEAGPSPGDTVPPDPLEEPGTSVLPTEIPTAMPGDDFDVTLPGVSTEVTAVNVEILVDADEGGQDAAPAPAEVDPEEEFPDDDDADFEDEEEGEEEEEDEDEDDE